MNRKDSRNRIQWLSVAIAGLLLNPLHAHGDDDPAATIAVSSTSSGIGQLVEGRMSFRGSAYMLTLRGLAEPVRAEGTVDQLLRAQDISGVFRPIDSQGVLRNASGVTVHFEPPLKLAANQLEIELSGRKTPKISQGHREGGVE
jgi:hypothetical protein